MPTCHCHCGAQQKLKIPHGKSVVRQTAVSYDASTILACCDDGTIVRWDLVEGTGPVNGTSGVPGDTEGMSSSSSEEEKGEEEGDKGAAGGPNAAGGCAIVHASTH